MIATLVRGRLMNGTVTGTPCACSKLEHRICASCILASGILAEHRNERGSVAAMTPEISVRIGECSVRMAKAHLARHLAGFLGTGLRLAYSLT